MQEELLEQFDDFDDDINSSTQSCVNYRLNQLELAVRLLDVLILILPLVLPQVADSKQSTSYGVDLITMYNSGKAHKYLSNLLQQIMVLPKLPVCCDQSRPESVSTDQFYNQLELFTYKILEATTSQLKPFSQSSWEEVKQRNFKSKFQTEDHLCFCHKLGEIISHLNCRLNRILFELISPICSSPSHCANHTYLIHQLRCTLNQLFKKKSEQCGSILGRLTSHACAQLDLISNGELTRRCFEEETVASVIRSLFVVDWLLDQYPYLVGALKAGGSEALFAWFRSKRVEKLVDKLSCRGWDTVRTKFVKCVLVSLSSRLYEKLESKCRSEWIMLDKEEANEDS